MALVFCFLGNIYFTQSNTYPHEARSNSTKRCRTNPALLWGVPPPEEPLPSGVHVHVCEQCACTAFSGVITFKLLRLLILVDEAFVSAPHPTLPMWLRKGAWSPVQHLPNVKEPFAVREQRYKNQTTSL